MATQSVFPTLTNEVLLTLEQHNALNSLGVFDLFSLPSGPSGANMWPGLLKRTKEVQSYLDRRYEQVGLI